MSNGFYELQQVNGDKVAFVSVFMLPLKEEIGRERAWQEYAQGALLQEYFLEEAVNKKKPVVLFVPEQLSHVTPLDELAPWIEGARVALSWTSAFARFKSLGNAQINIIKIRRGVTEQECIESVLSKINQLPAKKSYATPEQKVEKSISFFEEKQTKKIDTKNYFLKKVQPFIKQQELVTIHPNLPDLQEGQQRIVITGGAGFVGSHLVKRFLDDGQQVIVLDNYFCCGSNNLQEVENNKNLTIHKLDVSGPFTIEGPVNGILHLASVPSPEFYYLYPLETLRSGLQATAQTLLLAQEKNARYLFASSSEVYGDPDVSPQPEDYPGNVSPIGKRSQYDESKRGGETLAKLFFDEYNLDIRIVRIFNTYGPFMQLNDGRVITNFIQALLKDTPMELHGGGTQTRSFCYVSDTVEGIYRLFVTDKIMEDTPLQKRVVNIGNQNEMTIFELAQELNKVAKNILHKEASIISVEHLDPSDPKRRCPDLTRARKLLGYEPQVSLSEGLDKTVRYFAFQN